MTKNFRNFNQYKTLFCSYKNLPTGYVKLMCIKIENKCKIQHKNQHLFLDFINNVKKTLLKKGLLFLDIKNP